MQEYEYEKNVLTEKRNFKQYFWRTTQWAVWVILCVFIFSLFCFIIGLINDDDALHDAIVAFSIGFFGSIILVIFYLSRYLKYMSEIYNITENVSIVMKLTVSETDYMLQNLYTKHKIIFAKKDIESVDVYKQIIIVKLIPKRHLVLPNKPEINEIFKDYLEVDDKQKRK